MIKQLKTRQVCFFLLAFIPVSKIFFLPSMVAKCSDHDLWLSVIFSFAIDFTVLAFCLYACKKNDLTFFALVENTFGKVGGKIVCFLFVIYFLLKAILLPFQIYLQYYNSFFKLSKCPKRNLLKNIFL